MGLIKSIENEVNSAPEGRKIVTFHEQILNIHRYLKTKELVPNIFYLLHHL